MSYQVMMKTDHASLAALHLDCPVPSCLLLPARQMVPHHMHCSPEKWHKASPEKNPGSGQARLFTQQKVEQDPPPPKN